MLKNRQLSTKSDSMKRRPRLPEESPKVLVKNDHVTNSRNQANE